VILDNYNNYDISTRGRVYYKKNSLWRHISQFCMDVVFRLNEISTLLHIYVMSVIQLLVGPVTSCS